MVSPIRATTIATSPRGAIPVPITMESLFEYPRSFAGTPQPMTLVTIATTVSAMRNKTASKVRADMSTRIPKETKNIDANMI